MWMRSRHLHGLYGRSPLFRKIMMGIMTWVELANLRGHKDSEVLAIIRRVRAQRESLISSNEAFTIFSIARAQSALPGAMAEVGVYQGCSAKLISLATEGRPLHLFDTFDGLPEPGESERRHLKQNQYRSSLEAVRRFLVDRPNIRLFPGFFPASAEAEAEAIGDERYAFVHLDVDLKSSTRACLDYFYPRLVPGGIIMTHDYSYLDGVREAFSEFLSAKPERVIELPSSQAMLIRQDAVRLDTMNYTRTAAAPAYPTIPSKAAIKTPSRINGAPDTGLSDIALPIMT